MYIYIYICVCVCVCTGEYLVGLRSAVPASRMGRDKTKRNSKPESNESTGSGRTHTHSLTATSVIGCGKPEKTSGVRQRKTILSVPHTHSNPHRANADLSVQLPQHGHSSAQGSICGSVSGSGWVNDQSGSVCGAVSTSAGTLHTHTPTSSYRPSEEPPEDKTPLSPLTHTHTHTHQMPNAGGDDGQ